MDPRIDAARDYIKLGWHVFVLSSDKHPLRNCPRCDDKSVTTFVPHDKATCGCLTCHSFYRATTDLSVVEEMLLAHPTGNLGIRTGDTSGLMVIDAESTSDREDEPTGLEVLDSWESWAGPSTHDLVSSGLPPTLRQRTASGGLHLVYRIPAGAGIKGRNRVLPNVDLKANGGYIAVPPAPGRAWLDDFSSITTAAGWLVAWARNARGNGRRPDGSTNGRAVPPLGYDFAAITRDGCPAGCRDEFVNEYIFRMHVEGSSPSLIETWIRPHWERMAQPPGDEFTWADVLAKIRHVTSSVPNEETFADHLLNGARVDAPASTGSDQAPESTGVDPAEEWRKSRAYRSVVVREWMRADARDTVAEIRARNAPDPWADTASIIAKGRPERCAPSVFTLSDEKLAAQGVGLLYPGRYNTVFGDSGVGKSLLNAGIHKWYIEQGLHTVHMEFDNNNPDDVVWSIVDAGADPEAVAELFHVADSPRSVEDIAERFEIAYASLDAVNPSVALLGLEINSSPIGIDTMIQTYLHPFISRGACGLALDHVNHDAKDRTSNTIRKNQAVSGISYRMTKVGPGGRVGDRWMSTLTVVKDRPGWGAPDDKVAAHVMFDGTARTGACSVSVWKAPPVDGLLMLAATADGGVPTKEAAFAIVDAVVIESMTTPQITDAINQGRTDKDKVQRQTVRGALTALHADGRIHGEKLNPHVERSPWRWWSVRQDLTRLDDE